MKKSILISAIVLLMSGFSASAQQSKFGLINMNELIQVMPGRQEARTTLETHAQTLQAQFEKMQTELQTKYQDFIDKQATFSDLIKSAKERELSSLQENIQDFSNKAQEELSKKEVELLSPIIETARTAIKAVATENGYTHVFDIGSGALLHYPEGDNILEKVKVKLKIK